MAEETVTKEKKATEAVEGSSVDVAAEMPEEDAERTVYELGYHLVPTLAEGDVPAQVSAIKSLIEQSGGTFVAEEFPTHVPLAYPMVKARSGRNEKHQSAHFGWVKFDMPAENLAQVKAALDVSEQVLRYLLIKTVRADTRIPKRVMMPKVETPRPKPISAPPRKEEKSGPVSDEELDRTIEQLVVE